MSRLGVWLLMLGIAIFAQLLGLALGGPFHWLHVAIGATYAGSALVLHRQFGGPQ